MRGPSLFLLLSCLFIGLPLCNGGIFGFWRWFQGHYKEAVTKVGATSYSEFDHVMIDANQLAHMAARKAQDEDHAIRRLLRDIARTLKVVRPCKSVVIAFDGPAPLAKIITQRKRRSSEKELETPINSLHLTPGTAFMRRASDAIIDFCQSRLETERRLRNVRFYISGSESAGEGEVKLMEWINSYVKSPDESIVIVGGDADLVLQGLALPGLPDFNVFIPGAKRSGVMVSLRHLVSNLEKTFPGKAGGVRNDLVLLLIMSGNDYLPKIRGLTFRAKLEAYERVRRQPEFQDQYMLDEKRGTFNWHFLKAFCEDLASRTSVQDISEVTPSGPTPAGMLHELAQKKLVPPFTIEYEGEGTAYTCRLVMEDRVYEMVDVQPSLKAAKHEVARAVLLDLAPDVYQKHFAADKEEEEGEGSDLEEEEEEEEDEEEDMLYESDEDEEEDGIVDWQHEPRHYDDELYLSGLLWNFQMYNDGYCPDYSFAYRHRFAPSVSSLVAFIEQRLSEDAQFKLNVPVSTVPPFHAALSCLAVMPRWGLHLVPNNLSQVLLDYPRVHRMYKPGASFSLDLLVEAVTTARPNMVRSRHFYWNEVSMRWGKKAVVADGGAVKSNSKVPRKAGNSTSSASGPNDASVKTGPLVTVRRVPATSKPPLRSWEKRMPPLPWSFLTTRKWIQTSERGNRWSSSPRPTGTEPHDQQGKSRKEQQGGYKRPPLPRAAAALCMRMAVGGSLIVVPRMPVMFG